MAKEKTFKGSQKVYTNTRRAIIYLLHEYLFLIFMLRKASLTNSSRRPVCSCIKVIFQRQKRHLVTKSVVLLGLPFRLG